MKTMEIPTIKGRDLDYFANMLGLMRKRRFLFFWESDKSLRKRVLNRIDLCTSRKLLVPGVEVW